jgi:carbonic anhydrase
MMLEEEMQITYDLKFITAINCMDGRVQLPVIEWLKDNCNAKYVDMITEAGPNLILAKGQDKKLIESIKERVEISVNGHGSGVVAIVGHYDCAGNLAEKEKQIDQIKDGIKEVESWGFDVKVMGLWVNRNWQVKKVE